MCRSDVGRGLVELGTSTRFGLPWGHFVVCGSEEQHEREANREPSEIALKCTCSRKCGCETVQSPDEGSRKGRIALPDEAKPKPRGATQITCKDERADRHVQCPNKQHDAGDRVEKNRRGSTNRKEFGEQG